MDREKGKIRDTLRKKYTAFFFHIVAVILYSFTLDKIQFISYTNLKISNIIKVLFASVYVL